MAPAPTMPEPVMAPAPTMPEPAKPAPAPVQAAEPAPEPVQATAWTPPPPIVLTGEQKREVAEAWYEEQAWTAAQRLQYDTEARGDRGVYANAWRGNREALARIAGAKPDQYKDFERVDGAVADELSTTVIKSELWPRDRIERALAEYSPVAAEKKARGDDPARYAKRVIDELAQRRAEELERTRQSNELSARVARLGGSEVVSSGPSLNSDGPKR